MSFKDDLPGKRIMKTAGFQTMVHEVKLYGRCAECGGKLIEEKRN